MLMCETLIQSLAQQNEYCPTACLPRAEGLLVHEKTTEKLPNFYVEYLHTPY